MSSFRSSASRASGWLKGLVGVDLTFKLDMRTEESASSPSGRSPSPPGLGSSFSYALFSFIPQE